MELQLVSHNSAPNFEAPERWNCSRSSADMNWLILVQIIVTTYLGVLTSTTEGFHLKSLSIFVPAHKTPSNNISAGAWGNFRNLINAQKGDSAEGMGELKQYFRMFGYLNHVDSDNNITECYDEIVESAVKLYQQSFGLPVTGNLDTDTLSQIMMPRCGVEDIVNGTSTMFNDGNYRGNGNGSGLHTTKHYTFFGGKPKWPLSERNLTYAFSPAKEVAGITKADLRTVFSRAFNRWSAVIPVNFTLIEDYSSANIKIGFFSGNHGDHKPFDGVLGTLAHAFSPQDGRLHLDAAESWTIHLEEDNSRIAIDLESVATHEIGHILGLGHSAVKEAIMYPSIPPRTRKVNLVEDDVYGAQALYGSNPHFDPNLLSSTSTDQLIETSDAQASHTYSLFLFLFLFIFGIL